MSDMLGTIVRLQIQAEPLKRTGRYNPARLVTADRAVISGMGMLVAGERGWIVDAHHTSHPRARGGGNRPLSIGFTDHYAAMAAFFDSAPVGIAGENIIVDGPPVRMRDIASGLAIRTADGIEVDLDEPRVAAPCLPFTSFMLGSEEVLPRESIETELEFLSHGTRGFVVNPRNLVTYVEVGIGDEVLVR